MLKTRKQVLQIIRFFSDIMVAEHGIYEDDLRKERGRGIRTVKPYIQRKPTKS